MNRMNKRKAQIKTVYNYWSKTMLGKEMIKSKNVSDSDLIFLIPNNKKKLLGLPLTRSPKKKKRKYKHQRKRNICSFKLFDLIEEIIEDTLCSKYSNNEFFNDFVDIKDLSLGDENIYYG